MLHKPRELRFVGFSLVLLVILLLGCVTAPPEVQIVMDSKTVDCGIPVKFKYRTTDKEEDSIRAVSWEFGDGNIGTGKTPVHTYRCWYGPQTKRDIVVSLVGTDGHSTVMSRKEITVKTIPTIFIEVEIQNWIIKNHHITNYDRLMGNFRTSGKYRLNGELVLKLISDEYPNVYWIMKLPQVQQGIFRLELEPYLKEVQGLKPVE